VSNWAKLQEELVGKPVFKRAKHGIHFQNADGSITANFSGKPCHYEDAGIWKPIDTALIAKGNGFYGAHHSDVLIHTDGRVKCGNYLQLSELVGAKPGKVDGDRVVREFGFGVQYLYMKEDGFRQETVIERIPTKAEARYLIATESGQLPGHYKRSGITAVDADGDVHEFINLGQFKKWLDGAKYPVVVDPDFAGSTADGMIRGGNAVYATARASSTFSITAYSYIEIGQLFITTYECQRGFFKFDTSAIGAGSTVTQVNLTLTATANQSATDFDVQIVKQIWQEALGTYREANYDGCLAGTADDNIWRNTNGLSANTQYASGNLATTWVNKTGATYYSARSSLDFAGTPPTGLDRITIAGSDHATEAYRPVLTVTYTAAGVPKHFMHYARMRG